MVKGLGLQSLRREPRVTKSVFEEQPLATTKMAWSLRFTLIAFASSVLQLGIHCALLTLGLYFHELLFFFALLCPVLCLLLLVLAHSGYTLLTTIQNSETRGATVVLGTKCFPSLSQHVNKKSKGKGEPSIIHHMRNVIGRENLLQVGKRMNSYALWTP